ncbi:MAG: hypothetical protein ACLP50_07625 [Solirubrobacteraceae bacterium]
MSTTALFTAIAYQDETVAAVIDGAAVVRFPGPHTDHDMRLVQHMCAYAAAIQRDEEPGPYTDTDALQHAHQALTSAPR